MLSLWIVTSIVKKMMWLKKKEVFHITEVFTIFLGTVLLHQKTHIFCIERVIFISANMLLTCHMDPPQLPSSSQLVSKPKYVHFLTLNIIHLKINWREFFLVELILNLLTSLWEASTCKFWKQMYSFLLINMEFLYFIQTQMYWFICVYNCIYMYYCKISMTCELSQTIFHI